MTFLDLPKETCGYQEPTAYKRYGPLLMHGKYEAVINEDKIIDLLNGDCTEKTTQPPAQAEFSKDESS